MRYIFLILTLCASLYSQQSASEWWADASQTQRDFAEKCYKFGKQCGRGHTLAAIAWMESSLGKDTNHDEASSGYFGISDSHIATARSEGNRYREYNISNPPDFGFQSRLALQIFEDNMRYFRRLGYSPREAWFWAYPRYCAGKNWRRFKRRGEVFNERVRFLKREFKLGE